MRSNTKQILSLILFLFILVGCSQRIIEDPAVRFNKAKQAFSDIDELCLDLENKRETIITCSYAKTAKYSGFNNDNYEGFLEDSSDILNNCEHVRHLFVNSTELKDIISRNKYVSEYETSLIPVVTELKGVTQSIDDIYKKCKSTASDSNVVDETLQKIGKISQSIEEKKKEEGISYPKEYLSTSESTCVKKIEELIPERFMFFMNSHSKPAWVLDSDDNKWKDGAKIKYGFIVGSYSRSPLNILQGSEKGQNINLYYSDEYSPLIYEQDVIDSEGNILRTNTFSMINMTFKPIEGTEKTEKSWSIVRDTKMFELIDYKIKECNFN